MKYWFGYLVAAILAALTWALDGFAKAHSVLVDMIYPYISRLVLTTLADWTGAMAFSLWQILLLAGIAAIIVSIILMILFRWNIIRWLGWVLAAVAFVFMLNTAVYGLNKHASPLADDIRLEIVDYDVAQLSEAAVYYRDKANELAGTVSRNSKGQVDIESFEAMAEIAGEGFHNLTYEQAMSVFAGSTAPVKPQGWFRSKGDTGMMIPLTGEAVVNPKVPNAALPFAIGKEMAHRMSIYSEADAGFSSILAGMNHSDPRYQYAAYMMAYYYCYQTLQSIPTDTAAASASTVNSGVNDLLRSDLETCQKFFGNRILKNDVRTATAADPAQPTTPETTEATTEAATGTTTTATTAATTAPATTAPTEATEAPTLPPEPTVTITFSSYTTITDLLASWYLQNIVEPQYEDVETPFDPFDPTQVDISGIVNAPANP